MNARLPVLPLHVIALDADRHRAIVSALQDEGLQVLDVPEYDADAPDHAGHGLLIVELDPPSDSAIAHWRARHHGALVVACVRRTPSILHRALALGAEACVDTRDGMAILALVARNHYRLLERLRDTRPWRLDGITWTLRSPDGASVKLTRSEFLLLSMVARQPGQIAARDAVCAALGYPAHVDVNRAVDTLVRRLRRKAEQGFSEPLPLRTVRGQGFAFTAMVTLDHIG